MLKKALLSLLFISVIGAGGAAIAYQATIPDAGQAVDTAVVEQTEAVIASAGPSQTTPAGQPVAAAEGAIGDPWEASGAIASLDDYGMELALENGETVYVELGPPYYWQSQGVALQVGQIIAVTGTINEGQIHAAQVQLEDGATLQLRSEAGQPMWSGGLSNAHGQQGENGDGDHIPDPQAQVDEWITLEGTLMSFQNGSMTMSTSDGDLIAFQTGRPSFFAEQGVSFQVGDAISVVGFYEGDQFVAGEITQLASGQRVMLRDPNGRPLWAGPGNGNGRGGNQ